MDRKTLDKANILSKKIDNLKSVLSSYSDTNYINILTYSDKLYRNVCYTIENEYDEKIIQSLRGVLNSMEKEFEKLEILWI